MKPTNAPLNGIGPGLGPGVKRELEQRQLRSSRIDLRAEAAQLLYSLDAGHEPDDGDLRRLREAIAENLTAEPINARSLKILRAAGFGV